MKTLRILSILLVMAFVSQVTYAQCCKKGSSTSTSTSSVSEAKFSVASLNESVVKSTLAKVEGVSSYDVDAKASSFTVKYDSKKTDCEKIKSALSTAGVKAVNCESKCGKETGSSNCSKSTKS